MWKNILLVVSGAFLLVFLTLVWSGELGWRKGDEFLAKEGPSIALERAIEMHRPQILEFGGVELLCVPHTQMQGYNWHVEYKFYIYEDGVLRNVNYKN